MPRHPFIARSIPTGLSGSPSPCGRRRRAGLSLVETLMALTIAAALLTATVTALQASFHAYATAATTSSTQSSTRLVIQRLLGLIRTGTLHDAYDPDNPNVALGQPAADPVRSVGIQLLDASGQTIRVWWQANAAYGDADLGDLMYRRNAADLAPLLERVQCQRDAAGNPFVFTLSSRSSDGGLLLSRATVDLTVQAVSDTTLGIETAKAAADAVRMTGSTMPRRHLQ